MGTLSVVSEAERQLLYEAIGIPNALKVQIVNSSFGTGRRFENAAVTSTKAELDTTLEAIDTAANGGDAEAQAKVARLQELLAEWKRASTQNVRLHPVGSNQGVELKPTVKRRLIRDAIQKIIPVYVEARDGHPAGSLPLG